MCTYLTALLNALCTFCIYYQVRVAVSEDMRRISDHHQKSLLFLGAAKIIRHGQARLLLLLLICLLSSVRFSLRKTIGDPGGVCWTWCAPFEPNADAVLYILFIYRKIEHHCVPKV